MKDAGHAGGANDVAAPAGVADAEWVLGETDVDDVVRGEGFLLLLRLLSCWRETSRAGTTATLLLLLLLMMLLLATTAPH